jgi:hypothetical protein
LPADNPGQEAFQSAQGFQKATRLSKFKPVCQGHSSALRLVLFGETKGELPETLRAEVLKNHGDAIVKRNWGSVLDALDSCDVILDYSDDIQAALRRINELWRRLVQANYAARPAYIVIGKPDRPSLARFEIERLGGHFLHLDDVPARLGEELKRIDLRIAHLSRSSPQWLIVYEGNGRTLQASVSIFGTQGLQFVRADDRLAAELAVLITNNGIPRSIASWRKIMMNSTLFKPSSGGFNVPSRTTLRMHIHRDYIRAIQKASDEVRVGYSAQRIMERIRLGEKTVGYRIKGRWDAVRR